MSSDKPVLWSVVLQGDADSGYEVELRFSQKTHRFLVASPPDIGEIPALAGTDVRGAQTIDLLARNASVEDLRTIGRKLYRFLCFDAAQQTDYGQQLQVLLDQAKAEKRSLAFRLDLSQAPDLASVPWEALYSDSERSFLATRELFGLTRVRADQVSSPPDPVELPLKLLVVVADPTGTLDTAAEVDKLRELFDAHQAGNTPIKARYLAAATRESFAHMVFSWTPHVVHYIGHGEFDRIGSLWLHGTDDANSIDKLNAEELRNVFDDRPPWLIVLNSCEGGVMGNGPGFGGLAQELMHNAIPFVIAMQSRITNKAAIIFANGFYTALARREPVSHAVAGARKLLRVSLGGQKSAEMITPAIYASTELDEILIAPMPAAPVTSTPEGPAQGPPGRSRYAVWGSLAASLVAVMIAGGLWVSTFNDASFEGAETGTGESATIDDTAPTEAQVAEEAVQHGARSPAITRASPFRRAAREPAYANFDDSTWDDVSAEAEARPAGDGNDEEGPFIVFYDWDRWDEIAGSASRAGYAAIRGRIGGGPLLGPGCQSLMASVVFAPAMADVGADSRAALLEFATSARSCRGAQYVVTGEALLPGDGPASAALAFHRAHAAALALASAGIDPAAIIEVADWTADYDDDSEAEIERAARRAATVVTIPWSFTPIEAGAPLDGAGAKELYAVWGELAAINPELQLRATAWNVLDNRRDEMAPIISVIASGMAEAQNDEDLAPDRPAPSPTLRNASEGRAGIGDIPPLYAEARFEAGLVPFVTATGENGLGDAEQQVLAVLDMVNRMDAAAEQREEDHLVGRILLEGHSTRGADDAANRLDALAAVGEVADQLAEAGISTDRIVATACGARRREDIPQGADRAVLVSILPALTAGPHRACGWNEPSWMGDAPPLDPTATAEAATDPD